MGVVGGLSKGGVKDELDWFRILEVRVIFIVFGFIIDVLELVIRFSVEAMVEVAVD